MRKKKRLIKEIKKFKEKADDIIQSEGVGQNYKMRAITKLKNQVKKKSNDTKKTVIVSRNKFNSGPSSGRKTQGRKYKMVDNRMKKDLRG